jgi:flagellin
MRIQNNIPAINAHRQYGINNASIAKSVEKLSSGYRINRAGDDAAGLAISEKMRAQIRGLTMASKNSQDAISLIQTAEGALQESHNILQRMRELAVQSASDTNETVIDRGALQQEFSQLIAELNDTANKAKFNDQALIDGTFSKQLTSAVADGDDVRVAWANANVIAGEYEVTIATILNSGAIDASPGSSEETAAFNVTTNAGQLTALFDGSSTVSEARLNGVWDFNFSDGKAVATNRRTGEIISREVAAITGTNDAVINFGPLGTITLTSADTNANIRPEDYVGFSGQILVKDTIDEQQATYKHVARLNGDEAVLETGQTVINFKNTGLSVKLTDSLVADPLNDGTTAVLADFKITVSKNEGKALVIQSGANEGDNVAINLGKMDAYSLGVAAANIGNRQDASVAITQVNTGINIVSTQRAALGALQNRLEHKIANLDTSAENLQAAESRIRDVDMAKEMTTFMKNSILAQASTAMLAQANALPQGVLQLLG